MNNIGSPDWGINIGQETNSHLMLIAETFNLKTLHPGMLLTLELSRPIQPLNLSKKSPVFRNFFNG